MMLSVFAVLMRSPRLRFETEFVPTPQSKIEGSELSEQEFRFMSGKDMNSGNDGHMLDPRMLPSLNADGQDLTMAVVNGKSFPRRETHLLVEQCNQQNFWAKYNMRCNYVAK